jgi:hypothetical protein
MMETPTRFYSAQTLRHLRPEDVAPFVRNGAPGTPSQRLRALMEWVEMFFEEKLTTTPPAARRDRGLEVLLMILELHQDLFNLYLRCYRGVCLRLGQKEVYISNHPLDLAQAHDQHPTREECLAGYAAHGRPTAFQQYDGLVPRDRVAVDLQHDVDGDAIGAAITVGRAYELMQPADVRVLIPERTTGEAAGRLLRKIADCVDDRHVCSKET